MSSSKSAKSSKTVKTASKSATSAKNVNGKTKGNSKKSTKQGPQDTDAIFDKMDLNHDGRISVYELTKAARLLGWNPTKEEASEMIAECNPSQEGYVNKTEFKKLFQDKEADMNDQVQQIAEAFRVFDKDNSGTISREEIRHVLTMAGEQVNEAEFEEMLKRVDANGDGDISIEEFAAVMCDF